MKNKEKNALSGLKRPLSREQMRAISGGAADNGTCPLNCGTGCTEEVHCACKGTPNTYCVDAGKGG